MPYRLLAVLASAVGDHVGRQTKRVGPRAPGPGSRTGAKTELRNTYFDPGHLICPRQVSGETIESLAAGNLICPRQPGERVESLPEAGTAHPDFLHIPL